MVCFRLKRNIKMEKRHVRMSKIQKETFISLLEKHKFLLHTKLKPSDIPTSKKTWMEIATVLNELPGAKKNVKEWKDALNEMKVNARRKARLINIDNHGTGGGPKKGKDLSDLEERLLALLNKVVITGLPEITEVGVEVAGSSQNSTHNEELESINDIEVLFENNENIGLSTKEVEFVFEDTAENISEPCAPSSSKPPKKKKRFETTTERLAKNHEKCLNALTESNNNLARATYTLAKVKLKKPSAIFALKF